MKQGQATSSSSGSTKSEPKSQIINPGYASQLGSAVYNSASKVPMINAPGVKAPMVSCTAHHCGSQGKHK